MANIMVNGRVFDLTPTDGRKSFYGKAKVVVSNNGTATLYSYNTEICRVNNGRLEKIWNGWTATTGRHIAAFCNAYGIPYSGKKDWDKI